jgi:aspartyl-tRNA(Asn)/glutamyl-tRNA(Gln) amidotransferase subunit C
MEEGASVKITEQEVRYVAGLANLSLSEDEIHRMAHDLDEILTHIDKLNELDTSAVEPMAQVLYEAGETATLREDILGVSFDNETALANAPLSGASQFKVPKIIER